MLASEVMETRNLLVEELTQIDRRMLEIKGSGVHELIAERRCVVTDLRKVGYYAWPAPRSGAK